LTALGSVIDVLSRVDPRLVVAAFGFHLANICFRSLAWRNVLRAAYPERRVPLLGIAGAYAAGVAVNSFTPAHGGDVAKIALVRTQVRGSSVPGVISSMGVLSAFDALVGATLIGTLALLGLLPRPPGLPSPPLVGAHPLLAGLVLAAVAAAAIPLRGRLAPRLATIWAELREGAAVLGSPRRWATEVAPAQLSAWACRIGAAYLLLAAFGMRATLPAAVIVVMVSSLSQLVPTPGGVGTQQVLLAYLLHTTASTAALVSFSVGMQAALLSLNMVVGLTATALMLRTLRPFAALRARRAAEL
jgi:uncharacterized membrane protein YbhN (UPF0104 family)